MIALSIRTPWAWMITHAGKDIENRTWRTDYRGPLLIHTGKKPESDLVFQWIRFKGFDLPEKESLPLGGIVGVCDLVDCLPKKSRDDGWQQANCFGFKLANARPLPFTACKGALGLFEVEYELPEAA